MSEPEVRAIFLLAGIPITSLHAIVNKYFGSNCECGQDHGPWWLVGTARGLIEIGWRKRVISIDWSATPIRLEVTKDEVTKNATCVHAGGNAKAVEYLDALFALTQRAEAIARRDALREAEAKTEASP